MPVSAGRWFWKTQLLAFFAMESRRSVENLVLQVRPKAESCESLGLVLGRKRFKPAQLLTLGLGSLQNQNHR